MSPTADTTTAPAAAPSPGHPVLVVVVAILVALTLLVGVGAALLPEPAGLKNDPADAVAEAADVYLEAWRTGRLGERSPLVVPAKRGEAARTHRMVGGALQVRSMTVERGAVRLRGERATVAFTAELSLTGLGPWAYEGSIAFVRRPGTSDDPDPRWLVDFTPASIHPDLEPGLSLDRTREQPERALVLAADGTPLSGEDAPALTSLNGQVVGRVGSATDETAAERPDVLAGDAVGVSGLQAAYDDQLGGKPSGSVVLVDGDGDEVRVLYRYPGSPGVPLRTTIDPHAQAVAERTLGASGQEAALVAIQPSTGNILAITSRPALGFNRAMLGRYPPGSTFKVVTATALLDDGVTPDQIVPCPATATIEGRRFANAGGEALGDIPFREAFYESCNTAFVQLASELEPAQLRAAAELYGFNAEYDVGLPVAVGQFPEPEGLIDQVSAAIGQGRVLTSPLHMATVAAAVAGDGWRQPVLVPDGPAPAPRPLAPGAALTLTELMRLVVSQGTGTAAQLPGEPVAGKTGTAEFGSGDPPPTHAWFIAFRGDVAVAVLVENGGFGGTAAAPLARQFFAGL